MNNSYGIQDICAVVVSYNDSLVLKENILPLRFFLNCIVIVDNGSEQAHIDILHQLEMYDQIKIIYNNENKGQAFALNQGVQQAIAYDKKLLLTLDQDSKISKEVIERLINAIDIKKNVVSVGPNYMQSVTEEDKEVTYLITSGNLTVIEAIKKVGGYWNELFIDVVDIDFSFALRRAGYKLIKVESAKMNHKIGEYEKGCFGLINYLSHKPNRFYYIFRNNIIVFKKFFYVFPLDCIKMLMALIFIDLFKLIFIESNKKIKIKNALRGIREGMRMRV